MQFELTVAGIAYPQTVLLSQLYTNPENWRDSFRFGLDGWVTEEVKKNHRCAYIPFARPAWLYRLQLCPARGRSFTP